MTKKQTISEIKRLIESYGSFNISQLDIEPNYPIVAEWGNLVSQVDELSLEGVFIVTYNGNGDEVDHYTMDYQNIEISLLKEILEIALEWETQQSKKTVNIDFDYKQIKGDIIIYKKYLIK